MSAAHHLCVFVINGRFMTVQQWPQKLAAELVAKGDK